MKFYSDVAALGDEFVVCRRVSVDERKPVYCLDVYGAVKDESKVVEFLGRYGEKV